MAAPSSSVIRCGTRSGWTPSPSQSWTRRPFSVSATSASWVWRTSCTRGRPIRASTTRWVSIIWPYGRSPSSGAGPPVPGHVWSGARLIPYAALLHDIGHYAFSHALEELEPERIAGDHEEMSARFFESAPLRSAAGAARSGLPPRRSSASLGAEGRQRATRPGERQPGPGQDGVPAPGRPLLRGAVRRCRRGTAPPGPRTPAGSRSRANGRWGLRDKALSTLESLLFSKYQMFRTVYWHHAVRAATGLYKRIVETAVEAGILLSPLELVGPTDEELLYELSRRARAGSAAPPRPAWRTAMAARATGTPAAEAGNPNPRLATRREDPARTGSAATRLRSGGGRTGSPPSWDSPPVRGGPRFPR